jgi:restriction system protein
VALILQECGFVVEVERTIETARGHVEIDVYATETVDHRTYTTLVECKNWAARVPQSVIHSFRTVVADTGANVGYIVSRAGFQTGAFSAAALTNLRLVTWEEFQDAFERTWLDRFFVPTMTEELDPLFTYTEPLLPRWYHELNEDAQRDFLALREKHAPLGVLLFVLFTSYSRFLGRELPALPLRGNVPAEDGVPANILDAPAYRELLDAALLDGREAIAEFRALKPDAGPD